MGIKAFRFDSTLSEAFVSFVYDLYREDPQWIPPFRREMCAQLLPEFPFYQKPENSHRHFLATVGRKILGRVSAMVNRDLKDRDGRIVGIVGFFECVGHYEVARDLLDAATGWLKEEQGRNRIWGPMNFDIWHSYRMMTQGFDQGLFYGEPYNKSYYPDFFEHYGFIAKKHWTSVEVTGREALKRMISRGAERYRLLVEKGYRFESFNPRQFGDEVKKLFDLLTQSFNGFLGFTPLPLEEFENLFAHYRAALHPRLWTFVYDEEGDLAGVGAAFLELSDPIRRMRGRDDVLSKLRFLYRRRCVNRINFYIGGMTSKEATKKSGLGRAGFHHIVKRILEEGYERVVIALMAEGNPVKGLLREVPVTTQREYTLYELNR
jgi:hypothetical protein